MKNIRIAPMMELYKEPQKGILENSPELCFIREVCKGDTPKAISYFPERKQFTEKPVVVDTPYQRFEGREELEAFSNGFLSRFQADKARVIPMFQTRAGGRSVSEVVIEFEDADEIRQVPMFLVADLGAYQKVEELRIYCHSTYVPNLTPYRKPIFHAAHLEMGDPGLLTGAVKEYYTALHHMPGVDVPRILACMHPSCVFGGYEPYGVIHPQGEDGLLQSYTNMSKYIPFKVAMRYETLTDDGITGVIEWVHIISDQGRNDLGRIALSGIAAYQRGEDGRLISIRISDYAGYEKQIDWTRAGIIKEEAEAINAVHEFPAGVGRKKQEEL